MERRLIETRRVSDQVSVLSDEDTFFSERNPCDRVEHHHCRLVGIRLLYVNLR